MGIKDLVNKVKSRVTGAADMGMDMDFGDDFNEGPPPEKGQKNGARGEEPHGFGPEEGSDEFSDVGSGPEPEPRPAQVAAPAPQMPAQPAEDTSEIRTQLASIKSKLEVLEAHLETIESKGEMQRTEVERFMQYLSFLNEKLDHLEQEHSEIERLLQENTSQSP